MTTIYCRHSSGIASATLRITSDGAICFDLGRLRHLERLLLGGGKGSQELQCLMFQPHLVQVQKTLNRVGGPLIKQTRLPVEEMDGQRARLSGGSLGHETRIKVANKSQVRFRSPGVDAKVQSRQTDQVEVGVIMPGSGHAADRDVRQTQAANSLQQ